MNTLLLVLALAASPDDVILQAEGSMRRGDFEQACALLESVTSPGAGVQLGLGRCYFALGDSPRARRAFLSALEADPTLTVDAARVGPELSSLFEDARSQTVTTAPVLTLRPQRAEAPLAPKAPFLALLAGSVGVGVGSGLCFWQSGIRFERLANDTSLSEPQALNIETNAWVFRVAGITGAALAAAGLVASIVGLVTPRASTRVLSFSFSPTGVFATLQLP